MPSTKSPFRIGVIGSSGPVSPDTDAAAEAVGREIAKRGGILFCGGRDGVMEAGCRGAFLEGGITVGILPFSSLAAANQYVTVPVTTGLSFEFRSVVLVHACDAIIMVSGGAGTLMELCVAQRNGVPVVVLEASGGWAGRLRSVALEGMYMDERRTSPLAFAGSPQEAVELAFQLATKFRESKAMCH
ncbi:MAG: TIGR00725 family protein [Bacillota bacterium]